MVSALKIALNYKPIVGPFGGGIIFADALKHWLLEHQVQVVHDLKSEGIDIVLNISFLPGIYSASAFSYIDALEYKRKNPSCLIITRINNLSRDDRLGIEFQLFRRALKHSDHNIFISDWLLKQYSSLVSNFNSDRSSIIPNSARSNFSYSKKTIIDRKIKLVTHHWSDSYNKGHRLYKVIDKLLDESDFRDKYSFCYIGNLPAGLTYKNVTVCAAMDGDQLRQVLPTFDIYVTGAENEAAGMHHIEAACSGLPLLYVDSGALPEYCSKFGLQVDEINFEDRLQEMVDDFDTFRRKLVNYPFVDDVILPRYLDVFGSIRVRGPLKRTTLAYEECFFWLNVLAYKVYRKLSFWLAKLYE